jgi:hypothetical protein
VTDLVTEAMNTEAGAAAEALLTAFLATAPKRGQGISDRYQRRIEDLARSSNPGGQSVRIILCSRLYVLSEVDPSWTERHLLPLFDWSSSAEAAGAWQGYLWGLRMTPWLWGRMKTWFLQAFDHVAELNRWGDTLAGLLAAVAIEGGPETLSHVEAKRCLVLLRDEGRARVAFWIQQRLQGAGEKAGQLWSERIGPWIRVAWPPAPNLLGEKAAARLIWAASKADGAIQLAARDVLPLVVPIAHPDMIVHLFLENDTAARAPAEVLGLVDAAIAEGTPAYRLKDLLKVIADANHGLSQTKEFRRLQDIALTYGG